MSVKKSQISNKFNEFYCDNDSVNKKLDLLKSKILDDQEVYRWRHFFKYLKTFIEGEKDIPDFYEQFKKLIKFYNENPKLKTATTLELCKLKYGETLGIKKYNEKQNKNPFKNHNGKYSPFCKNSVNYNKESLEKAIKNRSYTTTLDYWIKKGFSEVEAKQIISKRQSTFSLEKCIEKFGKEEGLKIWNKRQEKWQNTLNLKSDSEKEKISFKKAAGTGKIDKEKPCFLYYIHFYNENLNFWKIGITTQSLEKRLRLKHLCENNNLNYSIIFKKQYSNCSEAHYFEHKFLKNFFDDRIKIDIDGFKSGECFKKDIFRGKYEF